MIVLRDDVSTVLTAQQISRASYRRVRQNVALAFLFNGIGIPLAATGLVYPVWAMVAMAVSVTTIFVNSLGGRPSLLFQAIGSVGRPPLGDGPPARRPRDPPAPSRSAHKRQQPEGGDMPAAVLDAF